MSWLVECGFCATILESSFYVDPLLCWEVKALLKDWEFLCLIKIYMINFLKIQTTLLVSEVNIIPECFVKLNKIAELVY